MSWPAQALQPVKGAKATGRLTLIWWATILAEEPWEVRGAVLWVGLGGVAVKYSQEFAQPDPVVILYRRRALYQRIEQNFTIKRATTSLISQAASASPSSWFLMWFLLQKACIHLKIFVRKLCMKKYRSRLDITAEILKIAQVGNGVNKTKIMYSAFLSFPQLKEYLAFMLENQLLEHVTENKNIYRTTEKGKRFLNSCREMTSMLFPSSTKEKTVRKAEAWKVNAAYSGFRADRLSLKLHTRMLYIS